MAISKEKRREYDQDRHWSKKFEIPIEDLDYKIIEAFMDYPGCYRKLKCWMEAKERLKLITANINTQIAVE